MHQTAAAAIAATTTTDDDDNDECAEVHAKLEKAALGIFAAQKRPKKNILGSFPYTRLPLPLNLPKLMAAVGVATTQKRV